MMRNFWKYCAELNIRGTTRACFLFLATIAMTTFFGQDGDDQSPCKDCVFVRAELASPIILTPYGSPIEQRCANHSCEESTSCEFPSQTIEGQDTVRNIDGQDPNCRCSRTHCGSIPHRITIPSESFLLGPCTGYRRVITLLEMRYAFRVVWECYDENEDYSGDKMFLYERTVRPYTRILLRRTTIATTFDAPAPSRQPQR